ncbi:family 16 glycosylhydrolase [Nocardioides anomalus]|uniref:Family 16 glycosylhydrolase n=1 Tax=Nocardioides anomalus TaxID=2712223 RepID=A0A6G6WII9_9ACTN|nr:family 16 glycosylhydrolase [Nocardioides anomalus]QIG44977.1 family 16 glycosylhydrolase [Nocardioides anomalus]
MFHRLSTLPRSAAAGVAVLAAVSLAVPLASPAGAERSETARQAPGPIHAGNTFGWYGHGGLVYDETFVGPLNRKRWHVEGPGNVRTQHGMLTLNTASKGTVSAQMTIPGRAYGRWETRLRQRQYGRGHAPYRVLTELVPVTKAGEGCGEQNIALNKFTMGKNKVNFYIRSRPDHLFQASMKRGFGQDQWHTFAVEVTRTRISWFVDSRVIRSETRPAALTGRKFQVRFTMQAEKGKQMNKARMQMDWLRYWTLQAKNERSTKAPKTKMTTYTQSCVGTQGDD